MANPWFRMYSEFATDPKMQMLSEPDQRRYLMLLCLRCSNGDVTLHDDEVAFQLRISNDEYQKTKVTLMEKGLIDETNSPCAWDKRQYKTDSSAERVAKHRAKKKQGVAGSVPSEKPDGNGCNVTGNGDETNTNAPDTDTDTDTDTDADKKNKQKKTAAEKSKPKKLSEIYKAPADVTEKQWQDYLEARKYQRRPMTTGALELFVRAFDKTKIETGMPAQALIEMATIGGWQTIKPDYVTEQPRRGASPSQASTAARAASIIDSIGNESSPLRPPDRAEYLEGELA